MTVGCVKSAIYALRDAVMSETVHDTTKNYYGSVQIFLYRVPLSYVMLSASCYDR